MNLTALFDGDATAVADVIGEFRNVIRPVGGGYAYGTSTPAPAAQQPSYQQDTRGSAGAPPGAQTVCPTHQQPATWREGGVSAASGKPYNGFWKCAVTGSSISTFDGKGLKPSCPPPK